MSLQRILKPVGLKKVNHSTLPFNLSSRIQFQTIRSSSIPRSHSNRIVFRFLKTSTLTYQPTNLKSNLIQSNSLNQFKRNLNSSSSSIPQKSNPHQRLDKNLISLSLFIFTGIGLLIYFKNEKSKVEERKREEMKNKSIGKVKVGGEFNLINVIDQKQFTQDDLLGRFSLIYFGFTNCPDICPEELDKMCDVVNRINQDKFGIPIQPIFVSVDPNRDTSEVILNYLKDFHSSMIGLTGSYESIKKMCKVYRVYFSTPPNLKPTDDYLVDHSIFFYLMAPNGNFVDAFGKIFSKDEVYLKVNKYMKEWTDGKRFGEEEE
ncbi:SCO1/SenC-domain-containing protein [Melampsora americana]|nr:SCO1/SenC-domain-containing protein [Melampsora americana]